METIFVIESLENFPRYFATVEKTDGSTLGGTVDAPFFSWDIENAVQFQTETAATEILTALNAKWDIENPDRVVEYRLKEVLSA